MPRGSKPGERRGGRRKGTPNKTTGALKDAILQAAELAGDDEGLIGYLKSHAKANPTAFLSLLGRVLPMTVAGDKDSPIAHSLTWLPPQ